MFFLFCFLAPSALAQLRFGFYGRSCPRAESIVANVVANRFRRDRSITAASLHMQLNDWFVTVRKFSFVTAASVHMQLNLYGVKNNDYKNSLRVLQEMKNQIKTHYFSATILDGVREMFNLSLSERARRFHLQQTLHT